MDVIDQIIAYENGELDDEGALTMFSDMVRTGQVWTLQGAYGRTANELIKQGFIERKSGKILKHFN